MLAPFQLVRFILFALLLGVCTGNLFPKKYAYSGSPHAIEITTEVQQEHQKVALRRTWAVLYD